MLGFLVESQRHGFVSDELSLVNQLSTRMLCGTDVSALASFLASRRINKISIFF